MEKLGDSTFSIPEASKQLENLNGSQKGKITLTAEMGDKKGFEVVAKKQLNALDRVLNSVAQLLQTRNWVELQVPADKTKQSVYINVNSLATSMGVAKKTALSRLMLTGSEQRPPGKVTKEQEVEDTIKYIQNLKPFEKAALLKGAKTDIEVRKVAGQERTLLGFRKKVSVETPVHTAGKTKSSELPRSVVAIGGQLYISLKKKGGVGSFKTIYLYVNAETREVFALAKLKSLNEADMHELRNEQKWQTLFGGHRNIAKTHGIVNWTSKKKGAQRTGILMPYIAGGNLNNNMRNLKNEQKLNISKQLFSSLSYIHGDNSLENNPAAIHNDLKPENIMLGDKGDVKLIDFGLTTEIGENQGGTSAYRAPEVWTALKKGGDFGKMDTKVDVWAAGCILYEMYTGQKVSWTSDADKLKGSEVAEGKKSADPLLKTIQDGTNLLEKQWQKQNRTEIQQLILDCLKSDPKDRISSQEARDRLNALNTWK
jgi:hypothetical protein